MTTENQPPVSTNKTDIIAKIGRTIEERRKARGLTHEKVSLTIKIKPSFLKSIETGDWKDLPGEVYARGFVIRYAQFLGMDSVELMAPYLEMQGSLDKNPQPTPRQPGPPNQQKLNLIWIGVGLVVVLGIIKFVVSSQKAAPKEEPVAVQAEAKPTATPTPAVSGKKIPHTIELYSPFPLWLSVKAESRSFEGFLPQGSSWTWKADGDFTVRLGHTQQITLMFDGKQIPVAENQKKITLPQ